MNNKPPLSAKAIQLAKRLLLKVWGMRLVTKWPGRYLPLYLYEVIENKAHPD